MSEPSGPEKESRPLGIKPIDTLRYRKPGGVITEKFDIPIRRPQENSQPQPKVDSSKETR
jgi:hypothetical protein